jgi:DNA-binding CsgD family transcriptional regulator
MERGRKGLLHRTGAVFARMWRTSEPLNLKGIRWYRCVYFLAYAFELMLFAARGEFIPVDTELLGLSGFLWMYLGHILFSLLVMLLWSNRFKHLIHVSVVVMVTGFIPFLFLPDGYLRLAFAIVFFAGLGGAVTSARCGYAFAVNNVERLVGMMVMFGSVAVIYFLGALKVSGVVVTHILPILLLTALVICLLKFREGDLEAKEESTKADAKGLYWALAYMIAFFAIDGYNWGLVDVYFQSGYILLCVGMVIAGAVFFAVLAWFKRNVWHVWNLFFVFAAAMALSAVLTPRIGTAAPQYFFSGLSLIGWPASLYMLAGAQRRFASYKLLKQCTVIFVILSPLTTLSDDVVGSMFPDALPTITLVYVLVVVFGFLLASPYSYKYLFSVKWLSDLHKPDMAFWNDKVDNADRFDKYNLSPREKEVLAHLLAGHTLRMVSGCLNIAQGTVNTHANRIYKKIGVNSKTELFLKFGVTEEPDSK